MSFGLRQLGAHLFGNIWRQTKHELQTRKAQENNLLCQLPKEVGPCRGLDARFFFSPESGTCQPFAVNNVIFLWSYFVPFCPFLSHLVRFLILSTKYRVAQNKLDTKICFEAVTSTIRNFDDFKIWYQNVNQNLDIDSNFNLVKSFFLKIWCFENLKEYFHNFLAFAKTYYLSQFFQSKVKVIFSVYLT